MQITVCIPSQWNLWRADMGVSLFRALGHLDCAVHLSPQNGPYLDENREASAREALELKSDVLVCVDTDMAFERDAISKLLAHDKDIVGANYYAKQLPLVTTVKLLGPDGEINDDGKQVTHNMPLAPFRCAGLGMGLAAINLHRLRECVAPPYFAFADHKGQRMGEDLSFCERARKAGMEVWCDPTIHVLHIGDFAFGKLD